MLTLLQHHSKPEVKSTWTRETEIKSELPPTQWRPPKRRWPVPILPHISQPPQYVDCHPFPGSELQKTLGNNRTPASMIRVDPLRQQQQRRELGQQNNSQWQWLWEQENRRSRRVSLAVALAPAAGWCSSSVSSSVVNRLTSRLTNDNDAARCDGQRIVSQPRAH